MVLAGSTWAVEAGRIVPVVGRSLVLAAGMGWASRSSCCRARRDYRSSPGVPSGPAMGLHYKLAVVAAGVCMKVVRPMVLSVSVYL